MDLTIQPGKLRGTVSAISSKSQAHRLLICAALADCPTTLLCQERNQDMDATADCLRALGAQITYTPCGYQIFPRTSVPSHAQLDCRESGSTLRFLLPVAGALAIDTTFSMAGRLPNRPLSPLWEVMEQHGCILSRPTPDTVRCRGKLQPGNYEIDGTISSQFITGLLFALSLLSEKSQLSVTGILESRPYVDMTLDAMAHFGVSCPNFTFTPNLHYHSPGTLSVEGDWSNAAFFLAANALGSQITVDNLNRNSIQGDRMVCQWLSRLQNNCVIPCEDIPDLVPILAVVAGAKQGAVFTHIQRLRLKESDRVASVIAMINALGGKAYADESTLTVFPAVYTGGTVDSFRDHRIAMATAIAATVCTQPVTILGAESVQKSYPLFWDEYRSLGGQL